MIGTQSRDRDAGTSLLYLHGFASSPGGAKAQALRSLFAQRGIELTAPDLNVPSFEELSFDSMCDVALETARQIHPGVVVGSSLGSLVALEIVRRGVRAPLVLIAPALGFGERWTSRVPQGASSVQVYHYGAAERRHVHRAFFEEMQELALDDAPPPVPLLIVMGTEDESVPSDAVAATWDRWKRDAAPGSRMISIDGGDHGLTSNLPEITAAIEEALALGVSSRL